MTATMTAHFRNFRDWLSYGAAYIDSQTVIDGCKYCSKCRGLKPLDEFPPYRADRARSGRFWQCTACLRADRDRRRAAQRKRTIPPKPTTHPGAEEASALNRLWKPTRRTTT